jgi:dihydrofolate synthase/folylpolyglutamate synthase
MEQETAYYDTLKYIYGFTDYEKKGLAAYAPEFYNLDRVRQLLALLGDPHLSFRSVHIAGTKGKGSTAAMIESMLRAAGYRTSLYTSPHLHTFRERIKVDGEMISEADVIRLIQNMRPLLERIEGITTFEVMTGLAFAWFAQQAVEWAVLEVGLGGRLDATNVVTPAIAVITSISRDHTAILGDTHAQIAAEKAGIIKPGVPVVSAPQSQEALAVIEATCRQENAPLTLVGRDWTWEAGLANLHGQSFVVCRDRKALGDFWLPLLGEYQLLNATTALATLSELEKQNVSVPPAAMRAGLETICWPGRLEVLGREPLVIVDSAHNGSSARKLAAALRDLFDFRRLTMVVGASTDHITPGLLGGLLFGAYRGIATQARHPRAARPSWIQDQAAELGFDLEVCPTVPEALEMALEGACADDLICCTGSVFVAAEARAAWFAREGMTLPPLDPT